MSDKPEPSYDRRSVCGIDELVEYRAEGVTHVLSLVDPDLADLDAFRDYPHHLRTILRFHDIIAPRIGLIMPDVVHVDAILRFGEQMVRTTASGSHTHLLVHCHMGVSRSTAAMVMLMAQSEARTDEDQLFAVLRRIRPRAWPNSRMIGIADASLGRAGRLSAALRRHYAVQLKLKPEFRSWMAELGRQVEVDMAEGE